MSGYWKIPRLFGILDIEASQAMNSVQQNRYCHWEGPPGTCNSLLTNHPKRVRVRLLWICSFNLFCCEFSIFKKHRSYRLLCIFFSLMYKSISKFSFFNHPISFIFTLNFRYSWLVTTNALRHNPQKIAFLNEFHNPFHYFNRQFFCWRHIFFQNRLVRTAKTVF